MPPDRTGPDELAVPSPAAGSKDELRRLPRSSWWSCGEQSADGKYQPTLSELSLAISRTLRLPASAGNGKLHDLSYGARLAQHESIERERARAVSAMPRGAPQWRWYATARSLHQLSRINSWHRYTYA